MRKNESQMNVLTFQGQIIHGSIQTLRSLSVVYKIGEFSALRGSMQDTWKHSNATRCCCCSAAASSTPLEQKAAVNVLPHKA